MLLLKQNTCNERQDVAIVKNINYYQQRKVSKLKLRARTQHPPNKIAKQKNTLFMYILINIFVPNLEYNKIQISTTDHYSTCHVLIQDISSHMYSTWHLLNGPHYYKGDQKVAHLERFYSYVLHISALTCVG